MMSKNIELRLEYVKLMQTGKEKEAFEVLKQIWALKGQVVEEPKVQEIIKPVEVVKQPKPVEIKKKENKFSLDDLSKIKGIGKETVKDIKLIYGSIDELINDLETGRDLPLRNDIEDKIKKHFGI